MARPRKDLTNRFRIARNNAGITLEDAAEIIGVTPAQIYNYERGSRFPSINVLIRIADMYGVSTDFLLRRDNPVLTGATKDVDCTKKRPIDMISDFNGGLIDVKLLSYLGEIPVKYVSKTKCIDSFAVLDQEQKCLRLPGGFRVKFTDVKKGEVYSFVEMGKPLSKDEVKKSKVVNVFSYDDSINLSGEYKVCGKNERMVRNDNDVTFHLSTYGLKWIAFSIE